MLPTDGVSLELASHRSRNIGALHYTLAFVIPENREAPIGGHVVLHFELSDAKSPLLLDFDRPSNCVQAIDVNGQSVPAGRRHGHLVIPPEFLRVGRNELAVHFITGDKPLNRNDDYLYSLFVPANASKAFPCFDQPDLKGTFTLSLEIPTAWQAVANAPAISRHEAGDRATLRFATTQPLPTYLFAFAAGRFNVEEASCGARTFRIYHRETDPVSIARNLDAIARMHGEAIGWLEEYTARAYPFDKLDVVLLPAFQFSGMEHAGAIFYNAPALLLEETATEDQKLARASLIAHETAHMWFGDLVTMTWFDDVWLKEVFANFMAGKIVEPSFPGIDHELRFLLAHYPPAYDVERTSSPNPIRQPLSNLDDAASLYGPIIYNKAPIAMRQLEALVGVERLRDGLREYISRFAFGNAAWPALIGILGEKSRVDLSAWSRVWIEEAGRPTVATALSSDARSIASLAFSQSDPHGRALLWTQQLEVVLGYAHGVRTLPLQLSAGRAELESARGLPLPRWILPNGGGMGYGLFKLDERSRTFLLEHLPDVRDAATRGAAWLTLWDSMLEAETTPDALIDLALRALHAEPEEQLIQRILHDLAKAYWLFISAARREAVAPELEDVLHGGMTRSSSVSLKAAYFGAFRRVVTTPDGVTRLSRLWQRRESLPGLAFSDSDDIVMSQELALRDDARAGAILAEQAGRIRNADRLARFSFVTPALSPNGKTRDGFFARLAELDNRRHEPWVVEALSWLNHPLRAERAEPYLRPGLDLLPEIQRTGDIFFPARWTQALLGGHSSRRAHEIVATFLAEPALPPKLRQIVEQASDTLRRAQTLPGSGLKD